eukprot:TRINITY_DN9465_c0_g1_i1.p5 TRINITY_DN9465_c0_g1~~TRINITY_DN9465_c0_g1_i1.p5  ORF type:complete len:111 (+),score=7.08 TRINITY_DN9465_c0_g1_i1:682-1014(+)
MSCLIGLSGAGCINKHEEAVSQEHRSKSCHHHLPPELRPKTFLYKTIHEESHGDCCAQYDQCDGKKQASIDTQGILWRGHPGSSRACTALQEDASSEPDTEATYHNYNAA